MAVYMLGILVPVFLSIWFSKREKKSKDRAVTIEVGGEKGLTKRNWRFEHLLETPWEGADTLAFLFEQTCARHCDNLLLGTRILISRETEVSEDGRAFEKVTLGHYEWTTYGQAFRSADDFASGLVAIGHEKGERVAIFAETRAEWFLALQACFRRNLTVVTIYASLGEEALVHSLNEVTLNPKPVMYITHCFLPKLFILPGTMFVEDGTEQGASTRVGWEVPWQTEVTTVVCDRKQLKKLVDLSRNLDTVKRVVYMEDYGNNLEPSLSGSSSKWTVASFSHVQSLGRQLPANPDMPLAADIAVIMYTSGSTGLPKGVMMSHRNMVATVAGVTTMVPGLGSKDVYLAYLPLAHVLEIAAESTLFAAGAAIGYGSPLTMTDTSSKIKHGTKGDVTELRPTLMTAVPAILDRIREGVRKKVKTKGGFTNTLFQFAYKRRLAAVEGSWLGAWGLEKHLWNAVVFRKIRSVLGGRVRGMLSGGAPLSGDTQRFINVCFGVPILQGYGLTETCAGATFCEWDDTSVGRVGPPVPQCYLKLVNWEEGGYLFTDTPMPRGEIVIGGPSVTMGYFKNTVKTEEVYKVDENGMRWFYTGDIGCFHQDGCVEIIDRKKDIVKLQHGEYVSLGKVEAVLSGSRYVDSIMLYADPFHSHCIAIIVAAQAALEEWANDTGVQYSNFADLCSNPATIKEVLSSISKVAKQAQLQKFEVPTKIKLLHEAWTPETGLVTAALKIKREVIRKTFADDLKNLYQ